jgi:hypothetical protein
MNWKGFREILSLHSPGGTEENHKNSVRIAGQDLNQGPPEYEARVLTTRPRSSVAEARSADDGMKCVVSIGDRDLIDVQLVRNSPIYVVPKCSLKSSQDPVTEPCF